MLKTPKPLFISSKGKKFTSTPFLSTPCPPHEERPHYDSQRLPWGLHWPLGATGILSEAPVQTDWATGTNTRGGWWLRGSARKRQLRVVRSSALPLSPKRLGILRVAPAPQSTEAKGGLDTHSLHGDRLLFLTLPPAVH